MATTATKAARITKAHVCTLKQHPSASDEKVQAFLDALMAQAPEADTDDASGIDLDSL